MRSSQEKTNITEINSKTNKNNVSKNLPQHLAPNSSVFIYETPERTLASTDFCRIKHFQRADGEQAPYFLNSNLLDLYDFPALVREKMVVWLMQQSSKRGLRRETCATSVAYMDMFLMRKGEVTISKIQQLGIACLNLAGKLHETIFSVLKVNPSQFSQQSVCSFQISILKKIAFRMNPPTYSSIAQELIINWQKQINESQNLSQVFCCLKQQSKNGQKELFLKWFEVLDCCIGIKEMLDYNLLDLVFNSFFVFVLEKTKRDHIPIQNFKPQILKILQNIAENQQFKFSLRLAQQGNIQFDEPLQKLIKIIMDCLTKFETKQVKNPYEQSTLKEVSIMQINDLSSQKWKSYYSKVIKHSSSKVRDLQRSFQI